MKDVKKNMDWYFPRVNGRVVVGPKKISASARPSVTHVEKENVEARHRASWRARTHFFLTLSFSLIFSVPAFAGLLESKETAPSSPSLVSHEAGYAAPAAKAAPKKKGGLPARDPQLEKLAKAAKSAQGVVTGISTHGVAVEYGSDPKAGGLEIWFNFVEKMKLTGFSMLSEIEEGDTVKVAYKEAPDHRRLVDEIVLVAKKVVEPPALPEAGTALEAGVPK